MAIAGTKISFQGHYKSLITALVIMVILLVAQPFLWQFAGNRARILRQERSQGLQIQNVKQKNGVIEAGIEGETEALSQLELVAPPAGSLTPIVERLEKLSDQRGLQLEIVSIREDEESDTLLYSKLNSILPVLIEVRAQGSVDRILSYLDQVEHIQELVLVTSWTLQPATSPIETTTLIAPETTPFELRASLVFFLRQDG